MLGKAISIYPVFSDLDAASGWLYKHLFRHGQTKNPELASLYANANKIINMTMFPVFVFDGPGRPALKRGVSVRGNAHWLEAGFKTMLTAFGFPYLDVSLSFHALLVLEN